MKKSLAETHPELAKQWHPNKNGDITPSDVTFGVASKVWWQCSVEDDHEWEAKVNSRTSGCGCLCCSGHKVVLSNCLVTTHPELASQWHSTKNGDLTPYDLTAGSKKKVWWKCDVEDDHEWESQVANRTKRQGCSCCRGFTVVLSNCLVTTHPELAKQWHPTKNGDLAPSDVIAGSEKKVWWQCDVEYNHKWEASVKSRSNGSGCPCCAGQKATLDNCLATTHPELAAQWHPTKNGNLTPSDIMAGSGKKVWWQCDIADDHEWEAIVADRKSGFKTCPICYCLATTHPELAKQWHPTKNGDLAPSDVIAGSNKKVWWQCNIVDNHEWETRVADRKKGIGCPTCSASKGEKAIREYLEQHQITHEPQKKFKNSTIERRPFDESVKHPMFTGLIEFQGGQHYFPVNFGSKKENAKEKMFIGVLERDNSKLQFCKENNIPLLIIPYWDIERIPEILDDILNGKEPTFSEPPKAVTDNTTKRQAIRNKLNITTKEVLCGLII